MEIGIRPMWEEDWESVSTIFKEGIATGNATFRETVPSWEEWDKLFVQNCRFVAEKEGRVVGWIALSLVSTRPVYAGVAELSVYVSPFHFGQGIGRMLLEELVHESEQKGFWTLQASIFPENLASLKIHYENGFRLVGVREKIGRHFGAWRDLLLLERRSDHVGLE
ncbi:MAG: N-acetyltransferase [Lunatimonas sp.]|uniref:GNAT family N-acetyltransferase n=1 Tax=Lunatimonas sp. TaxID=2060141 RepID=UPI00263B9E5D|nr:GNAT family N-acetyltransferase [Lunatimonas sp.]MCC5938806.1 N-acetyltransferase [Lunatimonas sp.]